MDFSACFRSYTLSLLRSKVPHTELSVLKTCAPRRNTAWTWNFCSRELSSLKVVQSKTVPQLHLTGSNETVQICCTHYHVLWCCCLGGTKGIQPVETEWWGTGVVICLDWGGPADATATPSSLVQVKSRMVYLSGASLHRLSWKKGR